MSLNCAATERGRYRRMLILRVTRNPMVTAGLMCPPLTCAIDHTMVATLRPKHSEIRTTVASLLHEPQATTTRSSVPRNSASSANQNLIDFASSMLVVDIFSRFDQQQYQTVQQSTIETHYEIVEVAYRTKITDIKNEFVLSGNYLRSTKSYVDLDTDTEYDHDCRIRNSHFSE